MIFPKIEIDCIDENVIKLIDKLNIQKFLHDIEYKYILDNIDVNAYNYLIKTSRKVTNNSFGNKVFIRGLLEISNYCKSDCFYCGIRKSNSKVNRYRLSKEEILKCCEDSYNIGFRTFVLQSGEDPYYSVERMEDIINNIRIKFPDVAITLSIGERESMDYKLFFEAGANRYLLRHESASNDLYELLHPKSMSHSNRLECLDNLKSTGFQVGVGLMINPPYQTNEHLVNDLVFIQEMMPAMCGIGPYITHDDTPFANHSNGSVKQTVAMLALVRMMHPGCLLPATTALGTIDINGRNEALLAGANVVMLNITPHKYRENYMIYQNKKIVDDEISDYIEKVVNDIEKIGLKVDMQRGDTLMEGYKCL